MKKTCFILYIFICFSICLFSNPAELYRRGTEFQMREDWYSAIEMYQSALKENPSYNLVYQGLAECFYALNEYDQALSSVETARSYKKDDADLQNLHGFILVGLSRIEEAEKIFKTVLQKYPNNPEARFGLAEIEVLHGKLYAASDIYKEALKRQGENRKALLSLALVSYEAGNKSIAEDYIKKSSRISRRQSASALFCSLFKRSFRRFGSGGRTAQFRNPAKNRLR
ncbi:tetratricopeptide repeat protein [Treponema pedis]|uniref:tetratricopeptide repeat protein n=1 Tax=Treponema pedis TaxID=409322 RepID=UPI0020918122|nr:tetratricopeptide repeat protein [Treponema pedis]